MGLETPSRFLQSFYKGDSFQNIMFAFLQTKTPSEKLSIQPNKPTAPMGSIFTFGTVPCSGGRQTSFKKLSSPKVYRILLNYRHFEETVASLSQAVVQHQLCRRYSLASAV